MAAKQMEEIQRKLGMLSYPRASAPAQSLLFAGMERYALLEWLFFRSVPSVRPPLPPPLVRSVHGPIGSNSSRIAHAPLRAPCPPGANSAGSWATSPRSRSKTCRVTPWIATRRPPAYNVRAASLPPPPPTLQFSNISRPLRAVAFAIRWGPPFLLMPPGRADLAEIAKFLGITTTVDTEVIQVGWCRSSSLGFDERATRSLPI